MRCDNNHSLQSCQMVRNTGFGSRAVLEHFIMTVYYANYTDCDVMWCVLLAPQLRIEIEYQTLFYCQLVNYLNKLSNRFI